MEFAEQVKAAVDIVRVVGEYVRLRKAGTNRHTGLCPFHQEKTPSFSVNTLHQRYKCFGCGAGGDVFTFIMEMEKVSFFEALTTLADRHGIPRPKRAEISDPDTRLRAAILQMHELAVETFRNQLNGPPGAEARAYLAKRGLSSQTIEQFGLGYSERSGRSLVRLFEQQKFTAEQMEKSGLVMQRPDGSFYDRFRNRLMFPIHSESGKTIAFGGRALEAGDEPKYLNSAETPIYRKSQVLYNLHRAKAAIRKQERSILVEGYMDAIGVTAAGIGEVVASCGTALTAQQVQMLKRHSTQIVVNFDPDAAGANAAERSISLLLEEGMHVRIAELDADLDPDEYCRERGLEAYRARMDGARGYFYWLADRARLKFDMRTAEGRVSAFQFLLPAVQRLGDKLERLAVVNDLAGYLGIEAGAVLENFRRAAGERREKTVQAPPPNVPAMEKILLNLMLTNAEAREKILPELKSLSAVDQFASRKIFHALFTLHDNGSEVSYHDLHARLAEEDQGLLDSAVLAEETDEGVLSVEQGMACLRRLQQSGVNFEIAALKTQIRAAERAGNLAEAIRLAEELNRRSRRAT